MENMAADVWPMATTRNRQTAWSMNVRIIVFSRPKRSDAQPQNTRLPPLARGLSVAASVNADAVSPHDRAIGPALAVTSRPPVAIRMNITYIT